MIRSLSPLRGKSDFLPESACAVRWRGSREVMHYRIQPSHIPWHGCGAMSHQGACVPSLQKGLMEKEGASGILSQGQDVLSCFILFPQLAPRR